MRHENLHRNYETQTVDPAEDRDTDLASSSVSSVSLLSVVFLSFLMLNEYHIITYSNCKSPCISQYRVNAIFLQKLLKHPIQEALPTWQLCFEVPQNDIGIISNLETVLGHLSKNPMKHKISSFSHPIFCKYLQAHIAAAMLGSWFVMHPSISLRALHLLQGRRRRNGTSFPTQAIFLALLLDTDTAVLWR